MLNLKIRRTQQCDLVEAVALIKLLPGVSNPREIFAICEKYLGESSLSCLGHRTKIL